VKLFPTDGDIMDVLDADKMQESRWEIV